VEDGVVGMLETGDQMRENAKWGQENEERVVMSRKERKQLAGRARRRWHYGVRGESDRGPGWSTGACAGCWACLVESGGS
jgi:hypothetical protein